MNGFPLFARAKFAKNNRKKAKSAAEPGGALQL
jgi:hypothetical protein